MEDERAPPASRTIWAYAYELDPPQPTLRLAAVKAFLDGVHAAARQDTRTWEGRFVVEPRITHILIVSDDAQQDTDLNRRLEAELRVVQAGYSRTAPLAVVESSAAPEAEGS